MDATTDPLTMRSSGPARLGRLGLLVAVLLLGTGLAGCGNHGGPPPPSGSTTTTTTAPDDPVPVGTEPTCEDGQLAGRRYVLCTAGDQPDQGLVVALHGRGSSAAEMRTVTELDRAAAGEGWAVVFPDGADGGWGDDTFTTPTRPNGDEDLVFLDQLIEALRADERIDDQPVGVVGFSNGASMALRYAAQRPDAVRAVVSVAGQLPRDPAIRPTGPVPLLEVYGTADPVRSYTDGIADHPDRQPGQSTPTLSTRATVAAFVDVASAGDGDGDGDGGGEPEHTGPTESDADPADGTRLRTERWTAADGTVVVLHDIVDGGHTWPSAHAAPAGSATFGAVSRDLDASAEAVAFVLDPAAVGSGSPVSPGASAPTTTPGSP
jgi:polyhydroxybutyrate depolymerase